MRKRKQRNTNVPKNNKIMSVRVLLATDCNFSCKFNDPPNSDELYMVANEKERLPHLRGIFNYLLDMPGERGWCIHKACACCPAITIDLKTEIEWDGLYIEKMGNTNPKERLIEVQPPKSITYVWYRQALKCDELRRKRVLTKSETIEVVSRIMAVTLPYYAIPSVVEQDKAAGKPLTSADVREAGDPRWMSEYELYLLENFA